MDNGVMSFIIGANCLTWRQTVLLVLMSKFYATLQYFNALNMEIVAKCLGIGVGFW